MTSLICHFQTVILISNPSSCDKIGSTWHQFNLLLKVVTELTSTQSAWKQQQKPRDSKAQLSEDDPPYTSVVMREGAKWVLMSQGSQTAVGSLQLLSIWTSPT